MVNGAEPTGGQSRPGGKRVLVTPSGEVVGSAEEPGVIESARKGSGKGAGLARAKEAEARQRARDAQRLENQRLLDQQRLQALKELQKQKDLTQAQQALLAREEFRLTARVRGEGFTQLETQRFFNKRLGTGGSGKVRRAGRLNPTQQEQQLGSTTFIQDVREIIEPEEDEIIETEEVKPKIEKISRPVIARRTTKIKPGLLQKFQMMERSERAREQATPLGTLDAEKPENRARLSALNNDFEVVGDVRNVSNVNQSLTNVPNFASVEPLDPESFRQPTAKTGFFNALGEVLEGKTLRKTGREAKGILKFESSPASTLGVLLEPLSRAGRQRGETLVSIPQFGSLRKGDTGFEDKTLFQLERESQIRKGGDPTLAGFSKEARFVGEATKLGSKLQKEFQAQIDAGNLTQEDAEAQAQEKFKQQVSLLEATIPKGDPGLRTRGSETLVKGASLLGEAVLIGGASKLAPGAVARAVDKASLKAIAGKRLTVLGKELRGSKGSLIKLKGARKTPSVAQEIDVVAPVFDLTKEGKLLRASVVGGRGRAKTELDSFAKRIQTFKGKEAKITSIEDFSLTARGAGRKKLGTFGDGGPVSIQKEAFTSKGFGDIVPKKTTTTEFLQVSAKPRQKVSVETLRADFETEVLGRKITAPTKKKVIKVGKGRRRFDFVGVSEDLKNDLTGFVSGKPKALGVRGGKIKVRSDIDSFGLIKRVREPKRKGKLFGRRFEKKAKQVTQQTTASKLVGPGLTQVAKEVLTSPSRAVTKRTGKLTPQVVQTKRAVTQKRQPQRLSLEQEFSFGQAPKSRRGQRVAPGLKDLLDEAQRGRQRGRVRSSFRFRQADDILADQKARLSFRTPTPQKTKTKTTQKARFTFFPPARVRAPFGFNFGFGLKTKIPKVKFPEDKIPKRKKKKKRTGREAVFFSPDFLSQAFGTRRRVTPRQVREIALSGDPFRRRPIPIFNGRKKRKKVKKRKKR